MKLVFYGGGHDFENEGLDRFVLDLINKKDIQITYVPSCSHYGQMDYFDFVNQYSVFGIDRILYFPIDTSHTETLKAEAFKSDIIHLSGGNTYYFLNSIKKNKLQREFKLFLKRGGVLTGLSAGGIIMTPNIVTASFPAFDCDENEVKLKNLNALKLVNFQFFPHYRNSPRYDKYLLQHSRKIECPLYACPDGSGIVLWNDNLIFHQRVYCFSFGKKMVLNP
jgi:dipeptidase E